MYIKILLSIVILIIFGVLGFYMSYKPNFRKNDLLELKRAIFMLMSEIKFLSSLSEALYNIENNVEYPVKNIFTNFKENISKYRGESLYNIWEKSFISGSKCTYLNEEDKKKFLIIGKVIGSLDKNFNIEGLTMVTNYIDATVHKIELHQCKNMKMYQSLGIFMGLIIVIVLI